MITKLVCICFRISTTTCVLFAFTLAVMATTSELPLQFEVEVYDKTTMSLHNAVSMPQEAWYRYNQNTGKPILLPPGNGINFGCRFFCDDNYWYIVDGWRLGGIDYPSRPIKSNGNICADNFFIKKYNKLSNTFVKMWQVNTPYVSFIDKTFYVYSYRINNNQVEGFINEFNTDGEIIGTIDSPIVDTYKDKRNYPFGIESVFTVTKSTNYLITYANYQLDIRPAQFNIYGQLDLRSSLTAKPTTIFLTNLFKFLTSPSIIGNHIYCRGDIIYMIVAIQPNYGNDMSDVTMYENYPSLARKNDRYLIIIDLSSPYNLSNIKNYTQITPIISNKIGIDKVYPIEPLLGKLFMPWILTDNGIDIILPPPLMITNNESLTNYPLDQNGMSTSKWKIIKTGINSAVDICQDEIYIYVLCQHGQT